MRRFFMLCSALILTGCVGIGQLEKPQVSLAGLELDKFGLFEQHFWVMLRVANPNERALAVDGVEFNLDFNGEYFASGVGHDKVTLPGLGEALVRLKVTTNLSSLWKQIRALQSLNKPLVYHMTGKLYAPWVPGGIAFDRKGELPALGQILPDFPGGEVRPVEKL